MKVILDASVLIAAMMKDGRARHVILHRGASFFVPAYVLAETRDRIELIALRAKLPEEVIRAAFEILIADCIVLPDALLEARITEARSLAAAADAIGDEWYIAAALAIEAPIWTYDDDFKRIAGIKLIGTAAVENA
jgi:predicted nucleic acid-binding protein